MKDLIQLPFQIQVVLAIGYLSYKLSSTGLNKKHKPFDVFMQVMVYGAIGYVTILAFVQFIGSKVPDTVSFDPVYWKGAVLGLFVSLVAAASWRRWGRKISAWTVRKAGVSWESFNPSVWDGIIQNTGSKWAHLTVYCTDESILRGDLMIVPDGHPNGPCEVDTDGNIAMYVTSMKKPDGDEISYGQDSVCDSIGRAHITYIPSTQIKWVKISRVVNRQAWVAETDGDQLSQG